MIGFEIDDYFIKLIYVTYVSGCVSIERYLCEALPYNTVNNGVFMDIDYIIGRISEFLLDKSIKSNKVSVLIKSPSIIVRSENVNLKTEREIIKFARLNGAMAFPIDVSSGYKIDFKIDAFEYSNDKYTVVTYIAVREVLINQYAALFKSLRISPVKIDIYESSISKLFGGISKNENSVIVTIDVCSYYVQIVILFCEFVIYRKQFNWNKECRDHFFQKDVSLLDDFSKRLLDFSLIDKLKLFIESYKLKYDVGDCLIIYLLGQKIMLLDFELYLSQKLGGVLVKYLLDYPCLIPNENSRNFPLQEMQGIIGLVVPSK